MQDFNFQRGGGDHYKMLRTPSLVGALNAWCAEWGSRIFSELYLRTKCGQTGRPAADLSLHPSDIPDACMLLHSVLLASISSAPMFLARAGPGMSGVGSAAPCLDAALCNWCLHHHHLSYHQSGQGAARHGMQHNIAHILILPLLHQRDMKIIQLRSAGDFSCALRELRLLLLSPPASAGGELAYKDTFPPEEEGVG